MRRPATERASAARLPAYTRRVLVAALLLAAPALLTCIGLLIAGVPPAPWRWLLLPAVLLAMLPPARLFVRTLQRPLTTMSSLLDALREGDYTLRGTARGAPLPLVYDINALAAELHAQRLRYEEATHLLTKTLAALDSAVFVFDAGQRLRLANRSGQSLLQRPAAALFGMSADALGLAPLLTADARHAVAHRFPARAGRFQIRHAELRIEGRGGRLLVVSDVGEVLRQQERAAWQGLLRVLGHEVNNSLAPIQSIAGTLATLLAREPLPSDWRSDFSDSLALIEHRAAALARFLAGYSALSRLPPPQRRSVDVRALLHTCAALETRVPVRITDGPALRLDGDADQLQQALINLLRNAAEAALPAGGAVHLHWQADGAQLSIAIDDDGPGPPPSDNLFVPFFTTKPGGSGIGLVLARQIIEAHGGSLTLDARTDAPGARACVTLPRR